MPSSTSPRIGTGRSRPPAAESIGPPPVPQRCHPRSRPDARYHHRVSLSIVDAVDAQRYEARLDDQLAGFLDYVVKRGRIALVHTEVAAAYEGRGIASGLARFALDDARLRGLPVIPSCPYVKAFLERHPEYRDVVAGATPR